MGEVVEFGDPEEAVVDHLIDHGYVGDYADRKPTTIAAYEPTGTLGATETWLQIQLDGTPIVESSWGVALVERCTVRGVFHTASGRARRDVLAGAALARGLTLAGISDPRVHSIQPLLGRSRVITDPQTKNLMSWFTVRVNLRPL